MATPAALQEFAARRTAGLALEDGTRIRIRPLLPEDKPQLVAGLERLSPESRFRRFLTGVERLSERELAYLTEIDYVDHFAWAAIALDEPGEPGIAVGRYIRSADPSRGEMAVTVVDDYQGRGLGPLLLRALAAVADRNGVATLFGWVLAENRQALAMLEGLGARIRRESATLLHAELDAAAAADGLRGVPGGEALLAAAGGEPPAPANFS